MTPADSSRQASDLSENAAFRDLLFGHTPTQDFGELTPEDLDALAAQAWEHLQTRAPGRHSLRVFNPDLPSGAAITVIESINDDMPFLLDSTIAELSAEGREARLVAHPIFNIARAGDGTLCAVGDAGNIRESLIHLHIERVEDDERAAILAELDGAYADIRAATADFETMRARVADEIARMETHAAPIPPEDEREAIAFLRWLIDGNFIFAGLRDCTDVEAALSDSADITADIGLGILRDPDVRVLRRGRNLVTMTPEIRQFLKEPVPLIVTKASLRSRIHRRAHLDYVGVKRFDRDGKVRGELRIVGLFAASAYSRPAETIPLIRRKIDLVTRHAGFDPGSHSARALANIVQTYPRDELFQIDVDTLFDFSMQTIGIYERPRARVLARPDRFDRFVSALVFVPRDKYDSDVRARIGQKLAEAYDGRVSTFQPTFIEGVPLTRVHYIIGRYEGPTPRVDIAALETSVAGEVQTWADRLRTALAAELGTEGRRLAATYARSFTAGYREAFSPEQAVAHIRRIERMDEDEPRGIAFEPLRDETDRISLKLFSLNRPMALTERVPVLADMGFEAVNERTYRIAAGETKRVWLHDMVLRRAAGGPIDLGTLGAPLTDLALAFGQGRAESDCFNALVLEAGLDWRNAALMRAISRYLRQINITFSHSYMGTVLVRHPDIAAKIAALFKARFDPARENGRADEEKRLIAEIEADLADVSSLDEDRILRRFVNTIASTVRTNAFQRGPDGNPKDVISFKLAAREVDQLPAPRPLYEIFVTSPRLEGTHLRFGKVARGGLRWSDRPEDFRTEVLGLVKAQQVKNAVIVPVGAKGGFVPKRLPPASDRAAWMAEGTESYRIFISSLIDLTDDLVDGAVVPPPDTVRHDDDDPYLVVAADKGTATFSDTANAIALERGVWLGDAFASGGSAGYDHKGMGITARGAWEAVKRHFRELDVDVQTTPFTVAGVGDMSGDVFGNGMLRSKAIKLVAAFDHRDIFFDPDSDPAASWAERKRLFDLPRSTWQDYDKTLISKGGGVFSRSAKSIALTHEIKALTGIAEDAVTPHALIRAVLKLDTDLLFFGGIGTYIRAEDESDTEAGDRANDPIRIRGKDVRATVIGEGANLGMTQRGRVEAALNGVRLNTDAIDNSAGVNTSDYEVNIKIALASAIAAGRLDPEARNALLAEMTDEVAALVLANNHRQTLALSLAHRRGFEDLGFEQMLMQKLESAGRLDRAVEFLPTDADLADRVRDGAALTRPEIAVLLAYAKNALFEELLDSGVPDDAYLAHELESYFPAPMRERFRTDIESHRLRRDIIATRIVNAMIDFGGPSLMMRLPAASGADAAVAYAAVMVTFRLQDILKQLHALDAKIGGGLQLDLYAEVQNLLLSRMIWFLRHGDLGDGLDRLVSRFRDGVDLVRDTLHTSLGEGAEAARQARADELAEAGVPRDLALWLASLSALESAPDIVLVAEQSGCSIADAAATLFAADERLGLDRIRAAVGTIEATDHYERTALDRAAASLSGAARRIAAKVTRGGAGPDAVASWIASAPNSANVVKALEEIARSDPSLAKLSVAADLLGELAGD